MDTIFNMPMDEAEARYLSQRPVQPMQQAQQRGLADYLPNVFGGNPAQVAGLLGEQQAGAISRQANVSGLLGAAIAIANGMSSQGPRRSAAQNILNALGTGLQTSQGVYQNALQQGLVSQRMAKESQEARLAQLRSMGELQQQDERTKLFQEQQALLNDPLIQKFPELRALVLKDPKEAASAIKVLRERQEFMGRDKPAAQAGSQSAAAQIPQSGGVQGEPALPAVEVTASNVSPLMTQIREADSAVRFHLSRGNSVEAERFQKLGNDLRAQLGTQEMQGGAAEPLKNVYPTLQGRVQALTMNAPSMTREQIVSEMNSILQADAKIREELDPTLFDRDVKKRKASAINLNIGDKEFGKEIAKVGAGIVERTYNNAVGAQSTLSTISRIKPLVQDGVYAGPTSSSMQTVDRLASVFGIASNDTQEKLTRTAEAMQGLASLELSAAEAMRGQGAITENERGLIKRAAAGDFATFTQKEVVTLLNALEKTANGKIKAHQKSLKYLRGKKETADLADLYEIDAPAEQPSAPMDYRDAAKQELQRRREAQRQGSGL